MRSGAPSTASDATEPANMPNSKPRSAAMRAETASCTEAGCTHAPPARISRNRVRRTLQRDGISPSLMLLEVSGLCTWRRSVAWRRAATAGHGEHGGLSNTRGVAIRPAGADGCQDASFSGVDGWREEPWCRAGGAPFLFAEEQHPM